MKTALNFGARLAVSGFGEGLEEGLQEVLEPAFVTMITGQEYEVDAGDVAYAFLMGYVTSNVFEAPEALRTATASTALAVPRFSSAGLDSYLGANGVDYFAGCQSAEDVKTRYRELAKENHPDAGGSQAVMAEINRQRAIRDAFYTGTQKAAETARRAAEPETGVTYAQEQETAQKPRETATGPKNEAAPGGTAVNENGLTALTELERTNLSSGARNKIVSTFQEAVSFVRNALTNRQSNARAYMGKIPDSVAARVLTDTGVDIHGYTAILPSDAVRHMFKNHGDAAAETRRGQIALTEQSAALLPTVLSSPDRVTFSNQADAYGRPTLMFEKQIGDLYITAQAVTEGRKALTTDTLYIKKTKASPATADATDLSPSQTSETGNRLTLSADSVTQSGQPVNSGLEGLRLPTVEGTQPPARQDAGGGTELPRLLLPTMERIGTQQTTSATPQNTLQLDAAVDSGLEGLRLPTVEGTQPPAGQDAGGGTELPRFIMPEELGFPMLGDIRVEMIFGERKGQFVEESDLTDKLRRSTKSVFSGNKVVGFNDLPREYQQQFQKGLATATHEVRSVLRRVYRKADYIVGTSKGSYHRSGLGGSVIIIGTGATPSTLAHEVFHKLDTGRKISRKLSESLMQDYAALNEISGGDVKGFLLQQYPEIFRVRKTTLDYVMRPEYRGIADILSGLCGGKVRFGFGHKPEYWKDKGALEAESWAQFGRVQYENRAEVIEIFKNLLPNTYANAIIILKGLV